jgi:hypothetical protein
LFSEFLELLFVARLVGIKGLMLILPVFEFLGLLVRKEFINNFLKIANGPEFELGLEVAADGLAEFHEVLVLVLRKMVAKVVLLSGDFFLCSIGHQIIRINDIFHK